jgi:hypothetical protein
LGEKGGQFMAHHGLLKLTGELMDAAGISHGDELVMIATG